MRTLVVYYSVSCGNTERIAKMVAETIGADTERIETVTPYSGSYDDIVEQGRREVNSGYMPEIRPPVADLSRYERIVVGTPTWWYTMAPAVLTFLKSNDFTGKVVVPFQTHGGWKGHALRDMKNCCKGASFGPEKDIRFDSEGGNKLITPEEKIRDWIAGL